MAIGMIQKYAADVLGLQELHADQAEGVWGTIGWNVLAVPSHPYLCPA